VTIAGAEQLFTLDADDLTAPIPIAAPEPLSAGPTITASELPLSFLREWNGWEWLCDGNNELWRTDGTAAGTVHIASNVLPEPPLDLGDTVYFFGTDRNLYRTRGTAGDVASAVALTDSGVYVATGPFSLNATSLGGYIYFAAYDDPTQNPKWYRTDGTTVTLFSDLTIASRPVAFGGKLFTYDTSNNLWTTDGVSAPVLLHANGASLGGVTRIGCLRRARVFHWLRRRTRFRALAHRRHSARDCQGG
jgi:hypothetical protein